MSPDRWNRVKQIFNTAIELDKAGRKAWLLRECDGDEALCHEVESLLAAAEGPPDFIDTPVMERVLSSHAAAMLPASLNWAGRTIGHYRIIEEIGHGGMSAVFRAARVEDHFEHEVAIKLLKQTHDTQLLLKRFRAERQILARLSHPNIAHLLDGGSTEEGLPYLVMEYVRGEPIDVYCERRGLDIAARLRLFRTLCDAVHYVHRHLMVHGDLKCSNVLVNEDGIVKLLDFGIARLVDAHPAMSSTHHKLTGLIALTPDYASPEQIRGQPVTTASDVYSLGVVLYKMLTKQLPHRPASGAYYDLATQICEVEPRRPSAIADRAMAARLRGDIDNIILKALQKDPDARYASAEQLAQDITSHLAGFPVLAVAESASYRLRKFVGRNRSLVAAGALVILSLVAGIFATSWQAHLATRESERAERHFNDVRKLAQAFMLDVHDSMQTLPGATNARRQIIAHSLEYLDGLAREKSDDVAVQLDLARAYDRVGDLHDGFQGVNLADTESAIRSYLKALEIRNAIWDLGHRDTALLRERLKSYTLLAQVSQANRAFDEARKYSRTAVSIATDVARLPGATVEDQRLLANSYAVEGTLETMAGEIDEGLTDLRKAISIYSTYVESEEHMAKMQRSLVVAYSRLGGLLTFKTDRLDEAARAYDLGFAAAAKILSRDPRNTEIRKINAYNLLGAGQALAWLGRHEQALDKRRQARDLLNELLATDPESETYGVGVGQALSEIGESLHALGQLAAARRQLEEAASLLRALPGAGATRLNTTQFLIASNNLRLARVLVAQASTSAPGSASATALWREACAKFHSSAGVLDSAAGDQVLEGKELDERRTQAASGLRECGPKMAGRTS